MPRLILVTQAQIEDRLSARRVRRIYDDDRDGAADVNPILRLRQDASSRVLSFLAPIGLVEALVPLFDVNGQLLDAAAAAQLDPELVRLTLDVAVAMAAQRHPTVMQMDWKSLMQAADEELTDIRMGKRTLIFPRPHGANHGGAVVSGNTATADAPTQRFWDDMGDF